jgi:calpain-7
MSNGNDDRFDKDKEFKRILDRFHKGHCLVTVATGDLGDAEADRAGLVPTHAYAMLDIREVKVSKLSLLIVIDLFLICLRIFTWRT